MLAAEGGCEVRTWTLRLHEFFNGFTSSREIIDYLESLPIPDNKAQQHEIQVPTPREVFRDDGSMEIWSYAVDNSPKSWASMRTQTALY